MKSKSDLVTFTIGATIGVTLAGLIGAKISEKNQKEEEELMARTDGLINGCIKDINQKIEESH